MFSSTTGLEADDFQRFFEFLDTSPRCRSTFYDDQNIKKPKSYPRHVEPGKKANLLAIEQFFM